MKYKLPYLLTYPRSGSHYFDDLVYKEAKIHIEKSHFVNLLFDKNNNKEKTILTIVRDPIDSINSVVAAETQNASMRINPHFVRPKVNELITFYILLYSFLCDHADYVIDFNDLVEYPDAVIKKTLNLLEINEENYNLFYRGEQPYAKEYIPSSKKLPNYDKDILSKYNFNIDLCYFYYNRLLEKKIIV
jgi:hypothetical protein